MKLLLIMTLTGSILALLVMLLRALLNQRLHPRVIYALWLPVLFSLLLPLRMESALSVRNMPILRNTEQSMTARMEEPVAYGFVFTPEAGDVQGAHAEAAPSDGASASIESTHGRVQSAPASDPFALASLDLMALIWVAGAALTGGYILIANLLFRHRIRRSRKAAAVPQPLQHRLGKARVYVSKAAPSPCLVGAIRPFIVVTPQALEDEARLFHVLTHERMHLRQGDTWWSLLRTAALVLHWFNPIVWIAASLSRFDCENACDALTIRELGEENRVDYGKTLLSFLRARSTPTALINTATTMAQSRRQIRRRISLIAKKRRYAWIAAALAVALVLTGCAVIVTEPRKTEAAEPLAVSADAQPQQASSSEQAENPGLAEALELPLQSDALAKFVSSYEEVLSYHVEEFSVWEEQDLRVRFPEFADCELYGRKNISGDAYVLVKLPELQNTADYQRIYLNIWEEARGEDDLCLMAGRIGALGESENSAEVRLDEYELHDVLVADGIYGQEDTLILIPEGSSHVLCALHTTSNADAERFVRSVYRDASIIAPEQGAYFAVPMLNEEIIKATGRTTAVTVNIPVEEDLLAGLEFQSLENTDMTEFWEDVECMSMMRLHMDATKDAYVALCSDRLIRYEEHRPVSVCAKDVYYERFYGVVRKALGIDPFFLLHSKAFQTPDQVQIESAALTFLCYETGEIVTQTLTHENAQALLDELRKLVFEPDDILIGGAGCPFGGTLTLRTSEATFTFQVAADSCGVLCYEGNLYLDYGDQSELFALFPECDPGKESTAANKPRTLEILKDGAEWSILEETDGILDIYEQIRRIAADGNGKKDETQGYVCLMDFRDENAAQLMHVQVRDSEIVVDGIVYPAQAGSVLEWVRAHT